MLDAAMVVAAAGMAQLVVLLQGGSSAAIGWLLAFSALAIVLLGVASARPAVSLPAQVYSVLAATALAALVIVILRLQVGLDPAAAGETVRQWAFVAVYVIAARTAVSWLEPAAPAEADEASETLAEAGFSLLAARELARARRYALPLAVLVLEPRRGTFERAQRRRDLDELQQVLAVELRLTDAHGVLDGRLVAVLPDTQLDSLAPLLARVRAAVAPELLERLEIGHASFPDEETTFVGLLERALERRSQSDADTVAAQSREVAA